MQEQVSIAPDSIYDDDMLYLAIWVTVHGVICNRPGDARKMRDSG